MIVLNLIGDNAWVTRLLQIPLSSEKALRDSLFRLVLRLQRTIQSDKLSGQVLRVKTGTLRRSITHQLMVEPGLAITGVVSTNVTYGKVHEYGFSGTLSVKAHCRQIKWAWGKPLKHEVKAMIKSHTRAVNYPARSFLRSALYEMKNEVTQTLSQTLKNTHSSCAK